MRRSFMMEAKLGLRKHQNDSAVYAEYVFVYILLYRILYRIAVLCHSGVIVGHCSCG